MNNRAKRLCSLAVLLAAFIASATYKSLINPLPSNEYRLERAAPQTRDLLVKAYGEAALDYGVVERVGGVLLQGTATPLLKNDWASKLKRQICEDLITYDAAPPNGQRYTFWHACSAIKLPFTDEFLAPIIEFVASDHTAIVTLLGHRNDPTPEEAERRIELDARFIVQFHPAFKDTLLGNMLLLADAAFVQPSVVTATALWEKSLTAMYGDLPDASPSIVDSALKMVIKAGTPECPGFDSYILVDVATKYEWQISNGEIYFSGEPYYSFWCGYPEPHKAHHYYQLPVQQVRDGAPYVYDSVVRVGQVAAFLRWYRDVSLAAGGPPMLRWLWDNSGNWNALVNSTKTIEIKGEETPGFWTPNYGLY